MLIGGGNVGEMVLLMNNLLSIKVLPAGAMALAIIKALITGPFQVAFDKVCDNILDMVPCCIQMRAAMQEFSKDAKDLLVNPASIFPDIPIQFSDSVRTLFDQSDPEIDSLTITVIQLLLQNHLIIFERQC